MATTALTAIDIPEVGVVNTAHNSGDIERWANEFADRINRLVAALRLVVEEVDTNIADLEARVTALEP